MRLLGALRRALAFIGRHGPAAFALSLIFGFAFPWLAAPAKPFIPVTIFCFIAVNMMRADLPALRRLARAPGLILWALVVNTLVPFLIVGTIVAAFGRAAFDPGLLLGLATAAAAPPLVAAPAYALLFGLSNALPLVILTLSMTLSPLVAPLIADAIVGAAAPIDAFALAMRLAIFLFGAMAAGLLVRRLLGAARIAAAKPELDGAGAVLFFIFAVGVTESVSTALFADPVRVLRYAGLAFGVSVASFVLTLLLWRRFGRAEALTLALATGLRNTGLLISVMGVNAVPEATFLFFALVQFPIYFAPQIIKPFVPWLTAPPASVARSA